MKGLRRKGGKMMRGIGYRGEVMYNRGDLDVN